jgi:hypothetical protein
MKVVNEETQEFNPNKSYTWGHDAQFILTGNEFNLVLNALKMMLATEEAKKLMVMMRATDILGDVLAKGVKEGVVKEVVEEQSSKQ